MGAVPARPATAEPMATGNWATMAVGLRSSLQALRCPRLWRPAASTHTSRAGEPHRSQTWQKDPGDPSSHTPCGGGACESRCPAYSAKAHQSSAQAVTPGPLAAERHGEPWRRKKRWCGRDPTPLTETLWNADSHPNVSHVKCLTWLSHKMPPTRGSLGKRIRNLFESTTYWKTRKAANF